MVENTIVNHAIRPNQLILERLSSDHPSIRLRQMLGGPSLRRPLTEHYEKLGQNDVGEWLRVTNATRSHKGDNKCLQSLVRTI